MKHFLLSIFVPRKMEEHRDLNLFLAVMIFILCALISVGIPSLRLKSLLKNNYLDECYSYADTYELTLEGFNPASLPSFEIDKETKKVINVQYPNNEKQSVYELKYKAKDGLDVNLTLVYEFDVTNEDELKFDLDAYLKQVPFDGNHNLISRDVLVIYTEQVFYYIFNRGYMLNYIDDKEGELETYHYINVGSWEQTGEWSVYKTERDENGKIVKDASGEIIYKLEDGEKVYNNNINQLFTNGASTNIGIFSYYELEEANLPFTKLENPIQAFSDILVYCCAESVGTYSYILSFFYMVILPILWVLVMWLLMKKGSVLTRFREYYSIAAISFIAPSILTAIVGLFIPYTIISKVVMIVQAVYYFMVVSRINSMPVNNTDKAEEVVIDIPTEKIETVPVAEAVETENKKPSIIE